MLVVDYYSKFPVVKKLTSIHSSAVIAHMKSIFEEHGIPSKLVTNNGTQYTSAAFQEFSRSYGFVHVTSSPLHPQSNGLSERTVQTVKDLLHKCKESGKDPHLAMLCLRSTPLGHDLPSPAELLNGRVYQTNRKDRRHLRATGENFQLQSDEVPDDVPVDESTACAADPGEHSISSAPAFPVSAACSPAEPPESVLQSSTADLSPVQPLRRSNRTIKALDRLKL